MNLPAAAAALVPGLDPARAVAWSAGATGDTWRIPRAQGEVLVKRPPAGMAALEAAGLRWLAASGLPTPAVLAADDTFVVLEWVPTKAPGAAAARAFGAALARTHGSGAAAFGVAPPGVAADTGWVGAVQVPFGSWPDWPQHYVHDRLRPVAEAARLAGGLTDAESASVARLCDRLLANPELAGPPGPPGPIHGDLWAGNLLWQSDRVLVVDPATCGGHAETDLAMLALFGAPHLADLVAGYEATRPLPAGWRDRIALHQVFPLLVHAAMFGGSYGAAADHAARRFLGPR